MWALCKFVLLRSARSGIAAMWLCFGTPSVRDIHSTQAADGESSAHSQRLDSLAQKYQELGGRRKEELLRRIDEVEREWSEFDERTNYPEPQAKTTVLLDKPSMIVRGRQLYIWHTVLEDARVKKGWKMKDAYQKWNEYIDDASEEEEDDVRLLGFTSKMLQALRRPEPLCTRRDANANTPDTIAECTTSLANSGTDSSPWQQLHDLAVEQQSYAERMALMGHNVDDDYN